LTGVEEIDRQHRSMVDGFRFLRTAVRRHEQDVKELRRILGEVEAHFSWEEAQMEKTEYPDKNRHSKDHYAQLSNLKDLLKYVDEGHEQLDEDFFLACLGWTERHIRSLDADFVQFLTDRDTWDMQQDLKAWEYQEHFSGFAEFAE
jgi:hemerythrin-like metal-binding protein